MTTVLSEEVAVTRYCYALAFMVLMSGPGRAQEIAVEQGFTPLFNGKDLSGWTIENKGRFTVKAGVIVLNKGTGWLRTDKEYQDFELRMDFRFVSKGANSGIFVRASQEGKNWPAKNYQVQTMDNESIAGLYVTALARPKAKRDAEKMRRVRKATGEWQSYGILLKGEHAEVKLNGALITVAEGLTVQRGHIGLQGEDGQLEFKNLRIKELK
jgi:hypothetical protein